MIPKIIHFCWYGNGEYTEKVKACIDSWKRILTDYEIKLWNESNSKFDDCAFAAKAYECKKYAFVSDYIRLKALYEEGGIYLDVDVEVIKKFDDILNHSCILALEDVGDITGAFMASEAGNPFLKEMIDYYHTLSFIQEDGSYNMVVNNVWLQKNLAKYGYVAKNKYQKLENGIDIYPDEYFHAKSLTSGKLRVTKNTYCIHHHTSLWVSPKTKIIRFIRTKFIVPIIGEKTYMKIRDKMKKGR